MEGAEINQVEDPQITTVETIITNDDLESDAVGEVIEAETYTDEFEVSLPCPSSQPTMHNSTHNPSFPFTGKKKLFCLAKQEVVCVPGNGLIHELQVNFSHTGIHQKPHLAL